MTTYDNSPALKPHPTKLIVETTTRCNLQCPMCMKNICKDDFCEKDMTLNVFKGLLPALPTTEVLILNGIGEPLLHPGLNEVIRMAAVLVKGTETILLVDDEKPVLEVGKVLLEALGYRVYAAGSGQEAIAVYMEEKDKIDQVVLDVVMTGMSGGETFDRLREIDPHVRVLLSSGYSINGEAKTIMDRGCNGFIQKPFHLEKLSGKVREMLD